MRNAIPDMASKLLHLTADRRRYLTDTIEPNREPVNG
jgi:hypothetical protein